MSTYDRDDDEENGGDGVGGWCHGGMLRVCDFDGLVNGSEDTGSNKW